MIRSVLRPVRLGIWLLPIALAASAAACGGEDGEGVGASGPGASGNGAAGASGNTGSGAGGGASSSSGAGASDPGGPRAFPGAQGFGTETPGGRGGKVYVVDTLASDGPGSFKEALLGTEPRIIVFRVSGVIDITEDIQLGQDNSYVTVAGQTSPGGVTLRGGGAITSYHNDFHDAVFRFLRFRGSGSYDNLSLNEAHHFVIDHCDFSGGEDETLDITFSHDLTVQWTTILNSGPNGQRYGFLLAYAPTTNISIHHTFSAHHVNRCAPHMHWGEDGTPPEGAALDFRNNVLYDCAFDKLMDVSGPDPGSLQLNLVGNWGKVGPNTPTGDTVVFTGLGASVSLFASDNVYEPGRPLLSIYSEPVEVEAPFEFPAVDTTTAEVARDEVLARAGAFPRDPMLLRTVGEVDAGTGVLGDVGDPLIESGPEPPPDGDLDGMADDWETAHGLDPSDPGDASGDADGNGYTDIEDYVNELAAAWIAGG